MGVATGLSDPSTGILNGDMSRKQRTWCEMARCCHGKRVHDPWCSMCAVIGLSGTHLDCSVIPFVPLPAIRTLEGTCTDLPQRMYSSVILPRATARFAREMSPSQRYCFPCVKFPSRKLELHNAQSPPRAKHREYPTEMSLLIAQFHAVALHRVSILLGVIFLQNGVRTVFTLLAPVAYRTPGLDR